LDDFEGEERGGGGWVGISVVGTVGGGGGDVDSERDMAKGRRGVEEDRGDTGEGLVVVCQGMIRKDIGQWRKTD